MNTLKKVVDASEDEWDKHIPAALYAYRVSKQASSKFTPFFLLYNRNPRKAISFKMDEKDREVEDETAHPEITSDLEKEDGIDGILSELLRIRNNCHEKAKKNISTAQQRQKKQYDSKHSMLKVLHNHAVIVHVIINIH